MLEDQVRTHLGPLWEWEGALRHDPEAYLHSGAAHPLPVLAAEA